MIKLPEEFIKEIDMFDGLAEALASTQPSTSIRLNPLKATGAGGDNLRHVTWCPDGRYLESRPQFTLDPALHQGAYYVQDASSMFIGHVIRQIAGEKPVTYLDACAAPGGKTTCALDALPAGSVAVANEVIPSRAAVLHENIVKWGCPNTIVTRCDARSLHRLKSTFDIVAADVPCSGEGMMRKEPEAVNQWSRKLIDNCAILQREIVDSLWQCIKPGGYMIYSTCTFNRTENEDMLRHIVENLGGKTTDIVIDSDWGITPSVDSDLTACHFLPGRVEGEGLFIAVIHKPGEPRSEKAGKKFRRGNRSSIDNIDRHIASMINDHENYIVITTADRISVFPRAHAGLLDNITAMKSIDIINAGVNVATIKGRDIIPAHPLAMSTIINRRYFAEIEVDKPTALDYLRCEAVKLPENAANGYVLLTYRHLPLGFVKNLGNRANNMYPRDWRIRFL